MEQVRDYNGEYCGVCKFCGQIVAFERKLPGEDEDGTATRLCDCKEAIAYNFMRQEEEAERRERDRVILEARMLIEELFGQGKRDGIGAPIMNENARAHLKELAERVYDQEIEKVTLSADGICATMTRGVRGHIKIKRKDTQEITREVFA